MGILKKLFGSSKKEAKPELDHIRSVQEDIQPIEDNRDDKVRDLQADTLKFDAIRASRMHEYQFALSAFAKSLEMRPQFETRYYYMDTLFAAGAKDEAMTQLNLLLDEEPTHLPSLHRRCTKCLEEGAYEQALKDVEMALGEVSKECSSDDVSDLPDNASSQEGEEDITYLEFTRCKAKALDGLGRTEEAVDLVETLIKDYPKAGGLFLLKGRMEIALKRFDAAVKSLDFAEELMPDEEYVPIMKARLAFCREDLDAALNLYQSVLDLDPFSIDAHLGMAKVYRAKGDTTKAIELLEDVNDPEMPNKDYLEALIELYKEEGNEDKVAELNEILSKLQEATDQKVNFDNLYAGGIF